MFQIIDVENLNEKELLQTLNHNRVEASFTRREIEKIKKSFNEKKDKFCDIEYCDVNDNVETIKEEYNDELLNDTNYYLNKLKNIDNKDFYNNLPINNSNNKRLLLRLSCEYKKEIKDFKELYDEEKENFDADDLVKLKEEINFYNERVNLIKDRINEKVIDSEISFEKNKFLFLTTESGNVRVLEDLKRIPNEFYFSVKDLFDSIINGTFKNIKTFKNNNVLAGISEVKNFKTRVVFDRVGDNEYVLLTCFMKKCDNDKDYVDSLKRVVLDYKRKKDFYKSKINDEEFMKLQEEITLELFNLLPVDEDKKIYSKEVILDE